MTEQPLRLRRHTDGRIALREEPDGQWLVVVPGYIRTSRRPVYCRVDDPVIRDPGWSELAVVELRDPDGYEPTEDAEERPAHAPYWLDRRGDKLLAWPEGVEDEIGLQEDLDELERDAVAWLSVVRVVRSMRVERDPGSAP